MTRGAMSRIGLAASAAALSLALTAGAALAGEVTGNGKSLKLPDDDPGKWGTFLHARSECAYSGQEDAQFPDQEDYDPNAGHAQSWGQIPKSDGFPNRDFLTGIGFHPGMACNPSGARSGE